MHTTLPLRAQLRIEEGLPIASMWNDIFLRIIGRRSWNPSGCLKVKVVGPIIRVSIIHVPVMHPSLLLGVDSAGHVLLHPTSLTRGGVIGM